MPILRSRRLDSLLLVGILVIAAFLRFYRLDSLPPGDNVDSAEYGLDALGILQGERPVFVPTNRGREALFSYLVAASFMVLKPSTLGIYATSALVGLATVPLVYLVGQELFIEEDRNRRRAASLLAALTVAVSYWHLNWSRYGVRAILVPLVCALGVLTLARGLRTGSRSAFLACGAVVGLSLYTYQAARALPALILLGLGAFAMLHRVKLRETAFNGILVFGPTVILAIPLVGYALTNPAVFNERTDETLVFNAAPDLPGKLAAFGQVTLDTLLMFSIRGDNRQLNHIPYAPALNPFLSIAFVLGILVALTRVRRLPYTLLLGWLVLMTAPAALAIRGSPEKRALGALPAVALLIALGLVISWTWVQDRVKASPPPWRTALPLLLSAVIGIGFLYTGVATYRDYFVVWGNDPDRFGDFEAGVAAIGRYVGSLPAGETVFVSPVPPDHMSIRVNSGDRPGLRGYNGRVCLVVPSHTAHDTTYVIVPQDDKNSLKLLKRYFPSGSIVQDGPLHDQQPTFQAYHVPAGTDVNLAPPQTLRAIWSEPIELLGFDTNEDHYKPSEKLSLTLYYHALADLETDYTVFVHLIGPTTLATPQLWAQNDSEPCSRFTPTSTWHTGDIVRDTVTLQVPAETPPGDYRLEVGLYDWRTSERLPVVTSPSHVSADHVVVTTVPIRP